MKKAVFVVVLAVLLLSAFSSVGFASSNTPAVAEKHGLELSGAEWGAAVSAAAQSAPAAIPLTHGRGPVGK